MYSSSNSSSFGFHPPFHRSSSHSTSTSQPPALISSTTTVTPPPSSLIASSYVYVLNYLTMLSIFIVCPSCLRRFLILKIKSNEGNFLTEQPLYNDIQHRINGIASLCKSLPKQEHGGRTEVIANNMTTGNNHDWINKSRRSLGSLEREAYMKSYDTLQLWSLVVNPNKLCAPSF